MIGCMSGSLICLLLLLSVDIIFYSHFSFCVSLIFIYCQDSLMCFLILFTDIFSFHFSCFITLLFFHIYLFSF